MNHCMAVPTLGRTVAGTKFWTTDDLVFPSLQLSRATQIRFPDSHSPHSVHCLVIAILILLRHPDPCGISPLSYSLAR